MARIQRDTVNYFPHDSNASAGDTLTVLQSRFGNDGYAFWFKLLEKLASAEGHYLDCRNSNRWQLLLAKTGVNEITGVEIMNLLVEMQAIDKDLWDSKLIWCQNLVNNLADVYKNRRREIPQKPVITGNNPLTTGKIAISTDSNQQSKVKESKVNNRKGEGGMGGTDREELYKILEGTKGFPSYSQENIWKLEDVMKDYPEVNYLLEFKKFKEYWNTRKLKRPWLALRNWLGKAKENSGKAKGRGLPNRQDYTKPPVYEED